MSRLQKLLGVGKGYLERLPPVDVHKLLRLILLNLPYIMMWSRTPRERSSLSAERCWYGMDIK